MKYVIATLQSDSPYSQSRMYTPETKQGESLDERSQRTWREYLHYKPETGEVFIPPTAFKNCLSEAAKYLSISVPGKGKATYTKNFESGVLVSEPLMLGIHKDDVKCEKLWLPSDGRRGGSKRVWKYYPIVDSWKGDVQFIVTDETILQKSARLKSDGSEQTIFEEVLSAAGSFIGIGRFRPRNNGYYGRFSVQKIMIES